MDLTLSPHFEETNICKIASNWEYNMMNTETSQTVLLVTSPKHFYGLCNHMHPAIVKKTIPNRTEPPYTVYLYVRKPKRGEDMAYIEVNDDQCEVKLGSPFVGHTTKLKPNCISVCGCVAGKCLCDDFQVMPCSSQGREQYAKEVGMTPNQLLDMSSSKDMGCGICQILKSYRHPSN